MQLIMDCFVILLLICFKPLFKSLMVTYLITICDLPPTPHKQIESLVSRLVLSKYLMTQFFFQTFPFEMLKAILQMLFNSWETVTYLQKGRIGSDAFYDPFPFQACHDFKFIEVKHPKCGFGLNIFPVVLAMETLTDLSLSRTVCFGICCNMTSMAATNAVVIMAWNCCP